FVHSISGEPEVGASLIVSLEPPGGRPMRFRPVIVALEPGRELRWKSKLLIPGLFDGEQWFRLRESGPGATTFEHGEQFSGLLVPRFRPSLEDRTRRGFVAMNEALKREAESADRRARGAP
ncbi:MAG TPA: SRPBCC domain-containing protein, partial [Dokdonella sp.]